MKIVTVIIAILLSSIFLQAEERLQFKDKIFERNSNSEDIKLILKAIAKENGSKIRIDQSVKGEETFDFNMPLEGAFNMIVEEYGLHHKVQDGVITVSATKIKKKIIVLRYLKALDLKRLLNNYDIIDRSVNRLEFGKGMDNTVFIEGKSEVIEELETLIGQLEKAEELKLAKKEKIEKESLQKGKFRIEQNRAKLSERRESQELEHKDIIFNNKLNNLNKTMVIDIIPLKYINVSKSEMEFQGQKIQVESLEDTLKGLLGTNYVDGNSSKKYIDSGGNSAFLKIDQRTNSVIIKDYPKRVEEVRKILKDPKIGLDKAPMLVEIEVTIAMGNSGFTEELGLKLGGNRRFRDNGIYGFATGNSVAENLNSMIKATSTNNSDSATLLQPIGALGLSSSMLYAGGRTMLNVQLNAMENEGLGKVLSNPRIVTLNNREATILSGNSVSIPTATADKMSLETVNTGISIKTKPHIVLENSENIKEADILLDISIEKSSLGSVTREKIETSKSKVNSNVIVKNGQTLILGGLFQYTKTDSEGGVPILKEIPLIGLFFKSKSDTLNKNELLFFITPRVITTNMVNEMQNHDYMTYKKNLEAHKKNLTRKLDKIDKLEKKKLKEPKRELNHLELLTGEEE